MRPAMWQPEDSFRYLDGGMDDAESASFELAVAQRRDLAEALARASRLREWAAVAPSQAADEVDWAEVSHRWAATRESTAARRSAWGALAPNWLWAAAAGVAVALAVWVALPLWPSSPAHSPAEFSAAAPTTAADPATAAAPPLAVPIARADRAESADLAERASLGDGSTIWSSPATNWTAEQDSADAVRIVLRRGAIEARVTRSTARAPFVVASDDWEVKVLGTRFRVERRDDGGVAVAVFEGRVRVTGHGTVASLAAGERRIFETPHGRHAEMDPADGVAEATVARADVADRAGSPSAGTLRDEAREQPTAAPPRREAPRDQQVSAAASAANAGVRREPEVVVERIAPPEQPSVDVDRERTELIVVQAAPTPSTEGSGATEVQAGAPEAREALEAIVGAIRAGRTHASRAAIEKWLRANPRHPNVRDAEYLLGYCLLRNGERSRARAIWKKMEQEHGRGPWLQTIRDWSDPHPPSIGDLR